jgi:hypothetical protein
MKKIVFILLLLSVFSCKKEKETTKKTKEVTTIKTPPPTVLKTPKPINTAEKEWTEEAIIDTIMKLPKVISSKQTSVLTLETPKTNGDHFRMNVGYNAPTHFATTYIFKVFPKPFKIIIEDQASGLDLTVSEWENFITSSYEDLGGDMENGFKTKSVYKSDSFDKVYQQYFFTENKELEGVENLQKRLPKQSKKETIEEGALRIEYDWKSKNEFIVVLSFAGGETYFEFKKAGNNIEVIKTMSAD